MDNPAISIDSKSVEQSENVENISDVLKKVEDKVTYVLPYNAEEFLSTMIDAYPKHTDRHTLRKIMSLGKVKYSSSKAVTAAVVNTKPYTLVFGRTFMSTKMESVCDCVWVLAHELTHLVLDHFAADLKELFVDKKLAQAAGHIVVDCQVNATVFHSLKEKKYFDLVKRLYSKTKMPECLLRPDGEPEEQQYKELHKKLYSKQGITNEYLIDSLMPWFKENQDKLNDLRDRLVGDDIDFSNTGTMDNPSDELSDLVEQMAQEMSDWLEKDENTGEEKGTSSDANEGEEGTEEDTEESGELKQGKQGGFSKTIRRKQIQTCLDKIEYAKRIKRQLNRLYDKSPSARIHEAIENLNPKRTARTPVPNFHDRRALALYAAGKLPIFYQMKERGAKVIVPCYVDVSGSQSSVIKYIQPVVSRLKSTIGEVVNCFSNTVNPCRVTDFAKGVYYSTGGTDFNPIAQHILENKYKAAVILTDGEAWLEDELIRQLKSRGVKITVGWTVDSPNQFPLKHVATKTFYVFKEGENKLW